MIWQWYFFAADASSPCRHYMHLRTNNFQRLKASLRMVYVIRYVKISRSHVLPVYCNLLVFTSLGNCFSSQILLIIKLCIPYLVFLMVSLLCGANKYDSHFIHCIHTWKYKKTRFSKTHNCCLLLDIMPLL